MQVSLFSLASENKCTHLENEITSVSYNQTSNQEATGLILGHATLDFLLYTNLFMVDC